MKGRTKAGILMQYSQELTTDEVAFKSMLKKDFEREKRKLIKRDSIRVLYWNMRSGYNQDDFMLNMFSVVYTGWAYKIPRIVKKLLLK
jgi:hypothetical protein